MDKSSIQEMYPVLNELTDMHSILTSPIDPDDGPMLSERLSIISVYMPRLAYIVTDAKYNQDCAIRKVFELHSEYIANLKSLIAKRFISSRTPAENYIVSMAEELLDVCKKQGDFIRTQISYIKSTQQYLG